MATIKKISLNGVSYDLGGGLTEEVKQASLQIAEKVAYIDENGQQYYDDLYNAFYDNTWAITANLSNAVLSNPTESVEKNTPYTTIISAATGYTLEGATVQVTMNGADITSSVYNNGTISIPSVTGDVVITVVAVELTVVNISAVYTQSGVVYDTYTLDSLKSDLIVIATFEDSSTSIVPSDEYTLTGTLAKGVSTISVTFRGETTTFTVNVSHGFVYTPDDGLFTGQSFVSLSDNGTDGMTETIDSYGLHYAANNIASGSHAWLIELEDYDYITHGKIDVDFMINNVGSISSSNSTTPGTVFFCTFDGSTSGGIGGFANINNTATSKPPMRKTIGTAVTKLDTEVEYGVWHHITVEVSNGKQSVTLDNVVLFSGENLATTTQYTTHTAMRLMESTRPLDLYIKRFEVLAD